LHRLDEEDFLSRKLRCRRTEFSTRNKSYRKIQRREGSGHNNSKRDVH